MTKDIKIEDIVRVLKGVIDPEMHIDIYSLGLVYDIKQSSAGALVTMTLTTPLCPYADEIVADVKKAVESLGMHVEVKVTFTPPWVPPANLRAIFGV